MSGKCAECKHWEPPGQRTDFYEVLSISDVKFGICKAIALYDNYDPAPDPVPLAVTQDGSMYKAILFTRSEFGCLMWETS